MKNDLQQWLPFPSIGVAGATVAVSVISTLLVVIGYLPIINALLLLPFVFGLYALTLIPDSRKVLLAIVLVLTFLLGVFIAIFRPAGFDYPLVWDAGVLYEGGSHFSLYVNLSKAIGGFLVLIWLWEGVRSRASTRPGEMSITSQIALVATGVTAITIVAYTFFGLSWEPKLPDGILYFVAVNLLVTILSEEAFFRLLLQRQIERFFINKKLGVCVAIAVASVLFALVHSAATGVIFFLFLFAGLIYAAVYAWTRNLLASISAHFGVNIIHFTLLEYPL